MGVRVGVQLHPRRGSKRSLDQGGLDMDVPPLGWRGYNQWNSRHFLALLSGFDYSQEPRLRQEDLSIEQSSFYSWLKRMVSSGMRVDVCGQWEYLFLLVNDLVEEFWGNPAQVRNELEVIIRLYCGTPAGDFAARSSAETFALQGDFTSYYTSLFNHGVITLKEFVDSAKVIAREPGARDMVRWSPEKTLVTKSLANKFDEIESEAQAILDEGPGSLRDWVVENCPGETREMDSRIGFTGHEILVFKSHPPRARIVFAPNVVAMHANTGYRLGLRVRDLFRDAENRVRERLGIPGVSEGWVSEMTMLRLIQAAFPEQVVLHQGRPAWLGRQSLDVYLPDANVAIEYQGVQHFEPVDVFGGSQGFLATLERDSRKRQLCRENGCSLIEVREGYSPERLVEEIRTAIEGAVRPPSPSCEFPVN